MARVKPKRHNIRVDMTAMTDVSFLLLTFFILTAQFAKPDVENITTPSSISEKLLPDSSLMTVLSTNDGRFYFTPVENGSERIKLLDNMAKKYGTSFTNEEKAAFTKIQAVGVPMNQLKGYLNLSEDDQKAFKAPGVPMDEENKQLIDWVQQSLAVNPDYKLAVKGDTNTKYDRVKGLFEGLRDIDFLKFWLITNQEVAN
ncbi:ExbD/TolR family protein [Planobacterium oryzisoli]|uniref:Biopolymer transporter ExbD n=1 Tax=Planobacterium oryzisoli TaxID=2771435 RepID=A0A930YWH8_9FLAO|nr:biopolymer transporter ExbD [Planobacterium oryzisoli]MBF5027703.1 biopolymer transporter ExbD [Planobacterium oryzisoli]